MIKKIPEQFNKNGYSYRLVTRAETLALYEQFSDQGTVGYEVHKVRLKTGRTCKYKGLGGQVKLVQRPTQEILAGNEDFGRYGWSYQTKENAINKYNELGGHYNE